MKVNYKIWIEDGEKFYGVGPHLLLRGVAQSGSLSDAAKSMKISYKKALAVIARAEEQLGFKLLDRKIGGASGGGSRLTAQGERWMAQFEGFKVRVDALIDDEWALFCSAQYEEAILKPLRTKIDSGKSVLLSIVGGGGKTTLQDNLWDAFAADCSTLYTTTTKVKLRADIETYFNTAPVARSVALYGAQIAEHKVQGVAPAVLDQLHLAERHRLIICEADGARRMPFKVHDVGEPVVPEQSTDVFVVVGCDAFVKPAAEAVHRHHLLELMPDQPIGIARALQYICQSLLPKLPAAANVTLLFNKYGQYGLPVSTLQVVALIERYGDRPVTLMTADLEARRVYHAVAVNCD